MGYTPYTLDQLFRHMHRKGENVVINEITALFKEFAEYFDTEEDGVQVGGAEDGECDKYDKSFEAICGLVEEGEGVKNVEQHDPLCKFLVKSLWKIYKKSIQKDVLKGNIPAEFRVAVMCMFLKVFLAYYADLYCLPQEVIDYIMMAAQGVLSQCRRSGIYVVCNYKDSYYLTEETTYIVKAIGSWVMSRVQSPDDLFEGIAQDDVVCRKNKNKVRDDYKKLLQNLADEGSGTGVSYGTFFKGLDSLEPLYPTLGKKQKELKKTKKQAEQDAQKALEPDRKKEEDKAKGTADSGGEEQTKQTAPILDPPPPQAAKPAATKPVVQTAGGSTSTEGAKNQGKNAERTEGNPVITTGQSTPTVSQTISTKVQREKGTVNKNGDGDRVGSSSGTAAAAASPSGNFDPVKVDVTSEKTNEAAPGSPRQAGGGGDTVTRGQGADPGNSVGKDGSPATGPGATTAVNTEQGGGGAPSGPTGPKGNTGAVVPGEQHPTGGFRANSVNPSDNAASGRGSVTVTATGSSHSGVVREPTSQKGQVTKATIPNAGTGENGSRKITAINSDDHTSSKTPEVVAHGSNELEQKAGTSSKTGNTTVTTDSVQNVNTQGIVPTTRTTTTTTTSTAPTNATGLQPYEPGQPRSPTRPSESTPIPSTPGHGNPLIPYVPLIPVLVGIPLIALFLYKYNFFGLLRKKRRYERMEQISTPLEENILEHIQHDGPSEDLPAPDSTSYGYTMTRKRSPRSTPKERRSRRTSSKGTVHCRTIIDIHLEVVDECQHSTWELRKNDFLQILVQQFAQEFTQHEFMQGEWEFMENQQEKMDGKQEFPNDERELMKDERVQDGRMDEFRQEECTQDEQIRGPEMIQKHVSTDSRSRNGGTLNPEEVEKEQSLPWNAHRTNSSTNSVKWLQWIERNKGVLELCKDQLWFHTLKSEWKQAQQEYARIDEPEQGQADRNEFHGQNDAPFLERRKDSWRQWVAKQHARMEMVIRTDWFRHLLENIEEDEMPGVEQPQQPPQLPQPPKEPQQEEVIGEPVELEMEKTNENISCTQVEELEKQQLYQESYKKKGFIAKLWMLILALVIEECEMEDKLYDKELYVDSLLQNI